MISTSSYSACNLNGYRTYSISGDRGKNSNYQGECCSDLAPKLSFWKKWHNNIGKISDEENNRYYVREYWNQVLSKLDPQEIYDKLDYSILLCYESNLDFCHRHLVAAWFEILLGVKVPEIVIDGYKITEVDRPDYIKQYLDEAMRTDRNMKGFNSLRALYLFEKSEKLEALADKMEEKGNISADTCRQAACYLRCDADMAEDDYNGESYKEFTKSASFSSID